MRVVGRIRVAGETVMFGAHVVDRFRQRVIPGLKFEDARKRLIELAGAGQLVYEQPRGFRTTTLRDRILNVAWLTFDHEGRSIVLPLVPWPGGLVAPTCVPVKE
jgi:hypothetical protein